MAVAMASGTRVERVAQAIKEEISRILHDELKDPRIGFVTLTRVELTADLRYARVYVSILGSEEEQRVVWGGIESAAGFIRRLVGQRLRLRFAPEIRFVRDESLVASDRVSQVIEQLRREQRGGAGAS